MKEEPRKPLEVLGDEALEARIVAWVLGEASAFEAAEIEERCKAAPELQAFAERMREIHGMIVADGKVVPDEDWRLPEEKRRKVVDLLGVEEKPVIKLKRGWRVPRKAMLAIAACILATLIALPMVLRMDAKFSPRSAVALHSFSASEEGLKEMDRASVEERVLLELSGPSQPSSAPAEDLASGSLSLAQQKVRFSKKPESAVSDSKDSGSVRSDRAYLLASEGEPDSNDDVAVVGGSGPAVFFGLAKNEPSDGWGTDDLSSAGEKPSDDPFASSDSSAMALRGVLPDPSLASLDDGIGAKWSRPKGASAEVDEDFVGAPTDGLNRAYGTSVPGQHSSEQTSWGNEPLASEGTETNARLLNRLARLNAPMGEPDAPEIGKPAVADQDDPFGSALAGEAEQLAKKEVPELEQLPALGLLFENSNGAVAESKSEDGSGGSGGDSNRYSMALGGGGAERSNGRSDEPMPDSVSGADVVDGAIASSIRDEGRMDWFTQSSDFGNQAQGSEGALWGREKEGSHSSTRGGELGDSRAPGVITGASFGALPPGADGNAPLDLAVGVAGQLVESEFSRSEVNSSLAAFDDKVDEALVAGGSLSGSQFYDGESMEEARGAASEQAPTNLGYALPVERVSGRRGLETGRVSSPNASSGLGVVDNESGGMTSGLNFNDPLTSNGGVSGNEGDGVGLSSMTAGSQVDARGFGSLEGMSEKESEQLGRGVGQKAFSAFGDDGLVEELAQVEAIDQKALAEGQHWDFDQIQDVELREAARSENDVAKFDAFYREAQTVEAAPVRLGETIQIDSISYSAGSAKLEEAQQRLNRLKADVDGRSHPSKVRRVIQPQPTSEAQLAAEVSSFEESREEISLFDVDGESLQLGSLSAPDSVDESVRWSGFDDTDSELDGVRGEVGRFRAKQVAEKMQKRISDAPLVVLEASEAKSPRVLSFDRRWESRATLQVRPEVVDFDTIDGAGNRDLATVTREDSLKGLSDNFYSEDLIRDVVDVLELPAKTGKDESSLIGEIKKGIKLMPVEGTDLVEFSFKNSDKDIASDVSAKLVEGARILESEKRSKRFMRAQAELTEAILAEEAKLVESDKPLSKLARPSMPSPVADNPRENWSESQIQQMLESEALARKTLETMSEVSAAEEPYSTFSLHVSDASFKLAAAAIERGEIPAPEGIRTEEFYNSFDYGDPAPSVGEPVACSVEQCAHPAFPSRNLLRIAVRTGSEGRAQSTPLNLTLLMDNSGSMEREDRSEGLSNAVAGLSSLLKEGDTVTVAGFSRTPRLLADRIDGKDAAMLNGVVSEVPAEGGTNLEEALKLGGDLAKRQWKEGAQNRVVLFTDGAANLGDADPDSLNGKVESLRQEGISFDAAGFGADGLNDRLLERLTRNGNGRYYVVDKPEDADGRFVKQLAGAFRPAAENVKVQVVFNPDRVGNYKLIGFDEHRLKKEDFKNDKVDAAEMASEEAGNALYQFEVMPEGRGEVGRVSVRFRDTSSGEMVERSWAIPYEEQVDAFDQAKSGIQLAGMSAFVAEKMKGAPMAEAVDFKELSPLIGTLPSQYADNPRIKQLRQMIDRLR